MSDNHSGRRAAKRFASLTAAGAMCLAGLMGAGTAPAHAIGKICNPTPTPTVSVGDDFVYEHQSAQVEVSLSWASCTTVKVDYNTSNWTALAGVDYVAKSGTVSFSPGQTSKIVTVLIVDDAAHELNESFYVKLKNPVGATLGDLSGKVTISGLEPEG